MISAPEILSVCRFISASNWRRGIHLSDQPEDDEEAEAADDWEEEEWEDVDKG